MRASKPNHERPRIGLTLDAENSGGYSAYPWYALRINYAQAIADAGGLPLPLPHLPTLVGEMLDAIDGLIVTGGAFDVSPSLYGEDTAHASVTVKQGRTQAELALLHGALARGMPVLGICGGEQLLAVALGGTLIQHIPDAIPHALQHEQPEPRHLAGHAIAISPGTLLHRIVGSASMRVNSSHHQAVRAPGRATVNAVAPDGVIEGIEDSAQRFCLGVQWHPEFHIDQGDARIFSALIEAARA
jgi:putative glutamine amidotransferase